MSTTVDQRVVEMRFDNKNFESNVSTTMSTLDKLKQKLNLTGASKGLEDIGRASKNVDMNGLARGVETVSARFSALQVMGVTALANITNSAVNAGKRMLAAFTTEPIKTGFQEYELKMGSVQTIMASTGESLQTVNKYLEELNTYSDKTIYSFSDMTNNIGKFTNAGVKLEDAVLAIKGISNEAAVSGANANEASRAMYNFSQALSSGYVKLIDWKSIENANMATVEFKQQLIESAVACGTLTKTADGLYDTGKRTISATQNFNDSLTDQWMTTEVLTKTLANYATDVREMTDAEREAYEEKLRGQGYTDEQIKKIEELGKKAYDSAQDVKTFSMMMDTLKEAAQSGWARTWELIIGDFEEAKVFWTDLSKALGGIIDRISDARNRIVEAVMDIKAPWTAITEKLDAAGLGNLKKVADTVDEVTDKLEYFQDVVNKVWRGDYKNSDTGRYDLLEEAGYDHRVVQDLVNKGYQYKLTIDDIEESHKKFGLTMEKSASETEKVTEEFNRLSEEKLRDAGLTEDEINLYNDLADEAERTGVSISELVDEMSKKDGRTLLIESLKNAGSGLVGIFKAMKNAWSEVFPPVSIVRLYSIVKAINTFSENLRLTDKETGELTETAKKLQRTFKGLFAIVDMVTTIAGGGFKIAFKVLSEILGYFNMDILDLTASIGDIVSSFNEWLESTLDISKILDKIVPRITDAANAAKKWVDGLKSIEGVSKFIRAIESVFYRIAHIDFTDPRSFTLLFESIKAAIDKLKKINLKEVGQYIIAGLLLGLDDVKKVVQKVIEIGTKIIEGICQVFGISSPSKVFIAIGGFIIAGLLLGLKEGFISVPESLQGIADKCIAVLKNIDWGTIFAIGVSMAALTFIKKVGDALEAFSAPFAGLGEIFESTAKVVKSFGKVTKAIAMDIQMKALKNLAVALAILVGSLVVLTYFYTKYGVDMLKAEGIILGLAVILGGLAIAVSKLSDASIKIGEDGIGLKASLLSIAAAIGILAIVVKLVGSMTIPEAVQGFIGLAGIMVALIAFLYVCQKLTKSGIQENIDKIASLMTRLSIAMLLMVGVCKLAGTLSSGEMIKGAAFAAAFVIFVRSLSKVVKIAQKDVNKLGSMMVKMAIAMGLMVGVCKLVSMLEPEEAIAGYAFVFAFAGFVKLLVRATKVGEKDQMAKLGGLLLSISFSMLLMIGICKLVNKLSTSELLKGAAFAAGFVVFVAALVKITKISSDQQMAKVAGIILAFSVVVGILAGVSIMMSLMSIEGLIKGVTAVSALGLIMAAMIAATRGANDVKGNLIVMTVAITLMAAAVAGLSFISIEKLAGATAAMTMLIGIFAVLVKVSHYKSNVRKSIATLAVLVVAVAMLAGVLYAMSKLEVKSALTNAASLSVLLLAVSGSMMILDGMQKTFREGLKSVALLAAMAGPLLLFTFALKQMNGVENAAKNAIILGGLILAMTGVVAILGLIGKNTIEALGGAISLAALLLPMLAFIVALKQMNGLENAAENAIVLGGLMTAMTIVLGVLTIIGFGIVSALAGVIALTALLLPMLAFIVVLKQMNGVENAAENASLLIALMTIMTGVLTQLAIIGPFALIGVAAMAGLESLIVTIGGIVVLLGALSEEIGPLIDSGLPLMIKLAEGIGIMIGSFVNGVLTSATQGLPQVGQNLSDFMTKASGFIEGAKAVNQEVVNGVQCLAKAIIALSVAEFISGITSLMTLGMTSFGQLGSDLSDFMDKASGFIEGSKSVNQEVVNGAKTLAGLILVLSAAEFLEGIKNMFDKLLGSNNFDALGSSLTSFAGVMVDFSNTITQNGGINSTAIEEAAKAGMLLVELQKSLPRTGGWIQQLLGEKDLAKFSASCIAFGTAIITFSNLIVANGGVNEEAVQSAVKAGELMSELQNSLPKTGGWLQKICGEQDLVLFSASCVAFAMCITSFSNTIVSNGGVNSAAIEAAVKAGELMSELQNSLPKTGGIWQKVAGEQDIMTFGASCVAFGVAMASFPSVEITDGTITSVRKSGTLMVELQTTLPKTGGWVQKVAGEQDIATFAASCLSFSQAMQNLASMPAISDATIESVKSARNMMTELQSSLPKTGGWVQNIAGENDLATFAASCLSFSQAMMNLSSMPVISDEFIQSVKNAGNMLVELQKSLPDSKWFDGKMNLGEFSLTINAFKSSLSNLTSLVITEESIQSVKNAGDMLVEFQKSIPDSKAFDGKMNLEEFGLTINTFTDSLKAFAENAISEEAVNAAVNAGNMMIALQEAIPESKWFDKKVNLEDFGKKIKTFGGYLAEYSEKVSEVDSSIVSSSITNANRLLALVNRLVDLDASGIEKFKVKTIGSEIKDYANKVADIDPTIVSSSITSANRLVGLIQSLAGIDTSGIALFQIKTIGDKLKAYSASVSGMDTGVVSSSIYAVTRLRAFISSLAGLDTSGVGPFKTAVENLGKIQVGNITKVFNSAIPQLTNVGSNLVNAIVKGMRSKQNLLLSTSSSMIEAVVNRIRKSYPTFTASGVALIDKLESGIKSKRNIVESSVTSILESAVSSILGYYDDFHTAGSYVVDGFTAGISDNAFKAEAEAVAMAEAALQAARKALGVASPSKEFYKIGDYAGQGFTKALGDYETISYNSSYEMADYARKGLSDAIRKIQDTVNSDLDTQPTIRPVLDLSDVRSGAAAIGSLFSGGTTMGIYSNVGSISSMMNQRIQNGGNYAVVSAIDDLRKDIGNLSNTTYSINGITYDDGSNISNAVESLVRAAKIERRI